MISEMMLAKEEYINGFIESVNEVYNDFNNFINTGLKISDEQINDFKNKILF